MGKLELVGLSSDGHEVVFVDAAGSEFTTPADERLRAALRGDRARLGQLEIDMDSALRPRDIQARIRGGESPESVAALAQVPVDKIMPYCVPVLAERQHIAGLAGRSHVRRRNADGPARRLADVVTERLRGRNVDADEAEWDAWRRDDGRWLVQVSYHSGERERTASFVFDAVGRYSLAEDDEAKWVTGERQSTSKGPQPREAGSTTERRLSSVPTAQPDDLVTLSQAVDESTGDDAFDDDASDDLTAVVRAVRETADPPSPAAVSPAAVSPAAAPEGVDESEVDESEADESEADESGVDESGVDEPEPAEAPEPDPEEAPAVAAAVVPQADPVTEPTPERRRRSGRRASVPSWDEIMFGKGKSE